MLALDQLTIVDVQPHRLASLEHSGRPVRRQRQALPVGENNRVGNPSGAAVSQAAAGDGQLRVAGPLRDAAQRVDPRLAAALGDRQLSAPLPGRDLAFLAPVRQRLIAAYTMLGAAAAALLAGALVAPRRR